MVAALSGGGACAGSSVEHPACLRWCPRPLGRLSQRILSLPSTPTAATGRLALAALARYALTCPSTWHTQHIVDVPRPLQRANRPWLDWTGVAKTTIQHACSSLAILAQSICSTDDSLSQVASFLVPYRTWPHLRQQLHGEPWMSPCGFCFSLMTHHFSQAAW